MRLISQRRSTITAEATLNFSRTFEMRHVPTGETKLRDRNTSKDGEDAAKLFFAHAAMADV